jgi:large subunit ribosomal protein L15
MTDAGLHNLVSTGKIARRRLGRGTGSGLGTTAGRGTKGQGARSGGGVRPQFEGGHTPLYRLMPKLRGFRSRFSKLTAINISELNVHFKDGEKVSQVTLAAKHLCHSNTSGIKILGEGELTKKLTVYAHAASADAKKKIEAAGGTLVLQKPKPPQVKRQRGGEPNKPAEKKPDSKR